MWSGADNAHEVSADESSDSSVLSDNECNDEDNKSEGSVEIESNVEEDKAVDIENDLELTNTNNAKNDENQNNRKKDDDNPDSDRLDAFVIFGPLDSNDVYQTQALFKGNCFTRKVSIPMRNVNNRQSRLYKPVVKSEHGNMHLPHFPPASPVQKGVKSQASVERAVIQFKNMSPLNEINFGDQCAMVIRMSDDFKYWAVGLSGGAIKLYPVENSEFIYCAFVLRTEKEQLPCTDIQFIPSKAKVDKKRNFLIATYASGYIRLWNYHGQTEKTRLLREWYEIKYDVLTETHSPTGESNEILAVSLSKDRQRFITGGDDHVIRMYEFSHPEPINMCRASRSSDKVTGHSMRITAVMYHPSGSYNDLYQHLFISASWDNTIQIWDDRYMHSIWYYFGPHVAGSDGIDIDPYNNLILSATWRRDVAIIQVWRFNHHATEYVGTELAMDEEERSQFIKPKAEFTNDAPYLPTMGYVARFCNKGEMIIYAGSNENMLRIINSTSFETLACMYAVPNGIYSLDIVIDPADKKKLRIGMCSESRLYVVTADKISP